MPRKSSFVFLVDFGCVNNMANYDRFSSIVGARCYHSYDQEGRLASVKLIINVVPGMSREGLQFTLWREATNPNFNWIDTESQEAYETAEEDDQQFLILDIYCFNVPARDMDLVWKTARALARDTAINLTNVKFYYNVSRIVDSVQPDIWTIKMSIPYSQNIVLDFEFDNEDNLSPVPVRVCICHAVETLRVEKAPKIFMLTMRKNESCYELTLRKDGGVACTTPRFRDMCCSTLMVTFNDFLSMAESGAVFFRNVSKVAVIVKDDDERAMAAAILGRWNGNGDDGRIRAKAIFPRLEGSIMISD